MLLFLQWPLRELFRGFSREANDLGQVVFALFVAVSVTAATRAGTHLAVDLAGPALFACNAAASRAAWRRARAAALGHLHPGREQDRRGVERPRLESFQDSGNPGYFLIKIALWVMAAVILGQALVDLFRRRKEDE